MISVCRVVANFGSGVCLSLGKSDPEWWRWVVGVVGVRSVVAVGRRGEEEEEEGGAWEEEGERNAGSKDIHHC